MMPDSPSRARSAAMPMVHLRDARRGDVGPLRRLLESAGLDHADLEEMLADVLVAEAGGVIVGTIGLEVYGSMGLLRSAAVAAPFRGGGIGATLIEGLEQRARKRKIGTLILLTTDAALYFSRRGFTAIDRSAVKGEILRSRQFAGACPASSTVMQKLL